MSENWQNEDINKLYLAVAPVFRPSDSMLKHFNNSISLFSLQCDRKGDRHSENG